MQLTMSAEQTDVTRRQLLEGLAVAGAALLAGRLLTAGEASASTAAVHQDMDPVLLSHLPASHFIQHGPAHRRNVALTIDDWWAGASFDYLPEVLDLAKEYDARLTLFPVGSALRDAPNYGSRRALRRNWRRAPAEGHVIGNHTYTHQPLSGMSDSKIRWELAVQHNWVNTVLGYRYKEHLMRPPGGDGGFPSQGNLFTHTLDAVVNDGYYMTMWSIDSNAPNGAVVTPNEDARFLDKIYSEVHNGSVILIHPTTLSVNGLHTLMHHLKREGYGMVSVPQLFGPKHEYWTTG